MFRSRGGYCTDFRRLHDLRKGKCFIHDSKVENHSWVTKLKIKVLSFRSEAKESAVDFHPLSPAAGPWETKLEIAQPNRIKNTIPLRIFLYCQQHAQKNGIYPNLKMFTLKLIPLPRLESFGKNQVYSFCQLPFAICQLPCSISEIALRAKGQEPRANFFIHLNIF